MVANRPSETGSEGFTLIEVLIAVAILGVSLAALFSGFSASLDRTAETRNKTDALALAQSLMDRTGPEIQVGEGHRRGVSEDGKLEWRIDLERYGTGPDRDAWPAAAYDVKVVVSWGNGAQSIELRELKIGQKSRNEMR